MNPATLLPLAAPGANALAGNAANPAGDGAAGNATGFARALDEARAPAPRNSEPSHQATNQGRAERGADDPAHAQAKAAATRQASAGRQAAGNASNLGKGGARAAAAAAQGDERARKPGSDARAETNVATPGDAPSAAGGDEAADGSAAASLLAMLLAHHPAGPAAAAAPHGGKAAATADAPTDAVAARSAHPAGDAHAEAGRLAGAAAPATTTGDGTQALSSFTHFAAELAAARREGGKQDAGPTAPQLPALPAAAPAATAATAPAAPVAEASLPIGPQHPAFGTQLGAQLTTFVRDGIEIARIHLHPAEMGPVTVQIRLEGSAAQVHLAAAQADTRQALDAALPTLAGALRDAGLTLAGGGVFQQPRDAEPHEQGQTPGRRQVEGVEGVEGAPGRAGGADAGAAGTPATRRRGVVDLIA